MDEHVPTEAAVPKKYRIGVMFVADRRWKVGALVALFCVVVGGTIRLEEWLF